MAKARTNRPRSVRAFAPVVHAVRDSGHPASASLTHSAFQRFIEFEDSSQQQRGKDRPQANSIKWTVVEKAEQHTDENHRNIECVLGEREAQVEDLRNGVDNPIGRRQHHFALDAQIHPQRVKEHRGCKCARASRSKARAGACRRNPSRARRKSRAESPAQRRA